MAIKKSDLYSSLWKSCDELRGSMDASQYKDYVLVLLFVKYISDKAKAGKTLLKVPPGGSFDDLLDLRNKADIGDGANKVIGALAKANGLTGVIDQADFNDADKLGRGQEMVDRLSNLIGIFSEKGLDFTSNSADGDDLLGDAYEYLMRNFATQAGKAKGQFYTPAEVSRVMAKLVGLGSASAATQTIYDPTAGSGSLLLRAHSEALETTGLDLAIYGQENDNATAALAKMNMILHGVESAVIWQGNTLAAPHFKTDKGELETFDYVVANPPFSHKSWMSGVVLKGDKRFDLGVPPAKNGDFAFLLHILASLKSTGKAAVILPHGVLFRGKAEAGIRRELVRRGYVSAIVGLPANLFFGTGIRAIILVLDKEEAATRTSIFMVDASDGFIKEGAKNRLREQDIHRIVDTVNSRTEDLGYSREVPLSEVADPSNDFNLNLSRYLPPRRRSDRQDVQAHLRGGIPARDIDDLAQYWTQAPELRATLFTPAAREGYEQLVAHGSDLQATISADLGVIEHASEARAAIAAWSSSAADLLNDITTETRPKSLVMDLGEELLAQMRPVPLCDEYDAYQLLMSYWDEELRDEVYLVKEGGWAQACAPVPVDSGEGDFQVKQPPKSGKGRAKVIKMRSPVLPRDLIVRERLSDVAEEAAAAQEALVSCSLAVDDLMDEYGGEDGVLATSSARLAKADASDLLAEAAADPERTDEAAVLTEYLAALSDEAETKKRSRDLDLRLNDAVADVYAALDDEQARDLAVRGKWLGRLEAALAQLADRSWSRLAGRLDDLDRRYASTLPEIEGRRQEIADEVVAMLGRLGVTL